MSIVEKAIGREPKREPRRTPESGKDPGQTEGRKPARLREPVHPDAHEEIVVRTSGSALRHLMSLNDDPFLAQDFRFLKRPLLSRVLGRSRSGNPRGNIVQLTSDLPGAGKSFVAFNFGLSLAREQMLNVFLIDGDPIRRNLTYALRMEDRPGLLEVLASPDVSVEDVALQTDMPSLKFIPAGQPRDNSAELLSSQRLKAALQSLHDPDTIVLLDSPPMLLTAEARVLVEQADHTVMVVEAGRTSIGNIEAVLKLLKDADASISFVLNKAPHSSKELDASYYGYGY